MTEEELFMREREELVDTAAISTESLLNGYGRKNILRLVDRLCSMHRTLQQKMVGEVVIPIVREMARRYENHTNMDARNEYACKVCAAMHKGLEAEFPYIANGECHLPLI